MNGLDLADLTGLDDNDIMDKLQEILDIENEHGIVAEDIHDDDCPECIIDGHKNTIIFHSTDGLAVCKNCGYIKKEMIEQCAEWRSGEDDGDKSSRCNALVNPLFPKASIGTQIGGSSIMQKTHTWSSMKYRERSLYRVVKEISTKCEKGGIVHKIERDAQQIYKIVSDTKHLDGKNKGKNVIVRGINRKSLIAACIYFACLKNKQARSVSEIADLFGIEYTELNKGCKTFSELLEMRKKNDNEFTNIHYEESYSKAEDFIERFCVQMHIKKNCIDIARKIAINAEKLQLAANHTPLSVATASIMLMIDIKGLSISKKNIASKFKISTVTLDRSYIELKEYQHVLVDDLLVDAIVEHKEKKREFITSESHSNQSAPIADTFDIYDFELMVHKLEQYKIKIKSINAEFERVKLKYEKN
jgi:transcription initiation factor TFIIB